MEALPCAECAAPQCSLRRCSRSPNPDWATFAPHRVPSPRRRAIPNGGCGTSSDLPIKRAAEDAGPRASVHRSGHGSRQRRHVGRSGSGGGSRKRLQMMRLFAIGNARGRVKRHPLSPRFCRRTGGTGPHLHRLKRIEMPSNAGRPAAARRLSSQELSGSLTDAGPHTDLA